VLSHLPDIGYGHIASYAAIARLVGHPQAGPRRRHRLRDQPAAGGAALPPCGALPGSMGGYLGGADAKRTLLTPEAAA
jgi:methylated-DNA-[protein]-cysteine S-methyltransferase